jgi:streptogramin lyase
VAVTADGGVLIADLANNRVRRVSPAGTITPSPGAASPGPRAKTGRPPKLNSPRAVALTPDSGLLIADQGNDRVRRVSPAGVITTVAGTGLPGFSGDDGPAPAAELNQPQGFPRPPRAAS